MDTSLIDDLPELMLRDEHRVRRRIDDARKMKNQQQRAAAQARIVADIERAQQRIERRRASVPAISYPPLPVSERKEEIAAAIRDHQVVIVAGETGSGKTTQLPKICLELGRGVRGLIGHTQPRRLAARTVADRIATELGTELGETVGFQIRFTDKGSERTAVKVMTDGILLAEIQNDRMLRAYDTIIIDEAHERSLNIDFLLGYLKNLLPRRPDLKLVITSATIDPERFSRHFGSAPIIEVSGRTYPVEVRYRPIVDPDDEDADPDRDQTQAISDAVDELTAEGPGDILVFLSGEREIRDTADALEKQDRRDTEILPLYARLSTAEQHRVFASHRGRRIVLATNVAETSLTVPGIKYVIDPGTARISRYSYRTKVQRLPIEAVSQASANQRKGRCGRTSDGICIRLYSEEDFLARPEFTDPEILRTNLASVILQMTALGLGDIAAFPFVEPPDHRTVKDGVNLLHELGAIDPDQRDPRKRLTALGRKLAQLPVDPRLGRMIIEADRNGCVREVMVIAAALSIQDPRERPADKQQQADEKHKRFATEKSDFMAYLNLWNYLRKQQKALSGNQFRKLCRTEFLNYLRVREWQDINSQLRQTLRIIGLSESSTPDAEDRIHISLLSGLLSHIGMKEGDRNEFLGARGARFAVFPGSGLFKKPPRWVMVAELVETSRLWGRMAAQIEPEWAEKLAPHLIKRNYSEPHWEKKRGEVVAFEKVTLYGIPIVASRKAGYGKVDPELARELFIRHALVEGDWTTHHKFFHANAALRSDVAELENRARRRDIVVDDETLFEFYDRRVGPDVVSARHFDAWWKQTRRETPDLLTFDPAMLVRESARSVTDTDYPTTWHYGDFEFPVTYQFEPGAHADGVTVHIPLALLGQVDPGVFEWQIPGLRAELFTALLRSLPKELRREIVPIPDYVRDFLAELDPSDGRLLTALERRLYDRSRIEVPPEAWDLARIPGHLKITFAIEDEGRTLGEGKDLTALTARLRTDLRAELSATAGAIERHGLHSADFDPLPPVYEQERGGLVVTSYPALIDEGDSVGIGLRENPAEAARAHWAGLRKLLMLTTPSPMRQITRTLGNRAKLALRQAPHGSLDALLEDCRRCAVDALMAQNDAAKVRTPEEFAALRRAVEAGQVATAHEVVELTQRILAEAATVHLHLNAAPEPAAADLRAQLGALIYPGFVTVTGWTQLPEIARYLQAMVRRMQRLPGDLARDREWTAAVHEVVLEYQQVAARVGNSPELLRIRWMIEELRVSYFAQSLGTPYPISPQRIYRAMDKL